MAAKSDMFLRKTSDFTTEDNEAPPALSSASRFLSTCVACSVTPPATSCPLTGSMPSCPEQKRKSPAAIACEYGPTAFGALSVCIDFMDRHYNFLTNEKASSGEELSCVYLLNFNLETYI